VPRVGDNVVGAATGAAATLTTGALTLLVVAFVVANYAYQGALPFYNAMMSELAPPAEQGRLSGLGTALGYVGSIAGVIIGMCFFAGGIPGIVELPAGALQTLRTVFPFTSAGGRVSTFVPTALLFLLFSLPLFLFCRDHAPAVGRAKVAVGQAFRDVANTVRDARTRPGVLRFIGASFLYQDAMGTIITYMALYAVEAVGFEQGMETTLFVALTIPAVLGSYLLGILADRIGPKRTLIFVIASWVVLLGGMIVAPSRAAFWFVGVGIGLIFGGVATAERPLLLSLVPDAEAGRYFSLMVMSARAAAIFGPLVWAFTVDGLTPSLGKAVAYRAAVGALALAMLLALLLLRKVPDRFAAARAARA
jgi:UMF1 family MFS transporter